MAKKISYPHVLAIFFSAFMSLVYLGLGIFLLSTDYGIIARDTVSSYAGETVGKILGYVLIAMGLLRAFGAYNKYRSYKATND